MKNNVVFAVTYLACYEGGDIFSGLENLFETKEDAVQHIHASMDEELENFDIDDMAVDRDNFKIEGAGHYFHWEIKECSLPIKTAENNGDVSADSGNGNSGKNNIGCCNSGNFNIGSCNIGNGNIGDGNTGNANIGKYNRGSHNTGDINIGNDNIGDRNVGNRNIGDRNPGNCNIGNCNIGCLNLGNYNTNGKNTGNFNTGSCNSGDENSGDFNITNGSNGVFNTIEPTIYFFNQPSDWTLSDWQNSNVRILLFNLFTPSVLWIKQEDMTEEEKEKHPEYATKKAI